MTQVTLTPQVLPAPYSATPYISPLVFTAADAGLGNRFRLTGDQILIAKNTGAGARTITISSTPDPYGRSGDVTALSIAAGATVVFSKFNTAGWRQTTGYLHIAAEHAEVVLAVLDLNLNRNFS